MPELPPAAESAAEAAGAGRCAALLLGREREAEEPKSRAARGFDAFLEPLKGRRAGRLCLRSARCGCGRCSAIYGSHRQPWPSGQWPTLPDAVLLQAAALLGPLEVCAMACACPSWAEAVTASQAWLWSMVACCSVPADVCGLLEGWSSTAQVPLRRAMQLWLCRPRLWGAVENELGPAPVSIWESPSVPSTAICSAVWRERSGAPRVAMGLADGGLHFGQLSATEGRNLRGPIFGRLAWDASVRRAHGQSLVTSAPAGLRARGLGGPGQFAAGLGA
ncbi:unnamed protein product [Effrenium voratum]|nr:unnamed protein product [Effrenium voratum]